MSKIALEGNASGTGTFTLAAPNTNSNYTLNLPTASGTLVTTGGAQTIEFAAGSAAAPSITTTGDTNTGIFFPAADTIAFSEGGVESMRIDSSGNVGIGVTPSAWASDDKALQIGGNGALYAKSAVGATKSFTMMQNAYDATGGFTYISTDLASRYSQVSGIHSWHTAPSGTAGNLITFTQAMTLDASGNLLIGTSTSGNFKLDVYQPTTNSQCYIRAKNNRNRNAAIQLETGLGNYLVGVGIGTDTNCFQIFDNNASTERMRITSDGRVGIGVSSLASPSSSRALFQISNSTNGGIICLSSSTTESDNPRIFGRVSSQYDLGFAAGGSTGFINWYTNGVERMRIAASGFTAICSTVDGFHVGSTQASGTTYYLFRGASAATEGVASSGTDRFFVFTNGNVTNSNGSYGTISDQKLKQDIVDANSQWNDIKNIRFRKYRMKAEVAENLDAPYLLGFIAQELETVSPGLIEEHTDRDKEGNDLGTTTKSIKTSILYMKAVKALQEAMLRIEALETEVAALKAK